MAIFDQIHEQMIMIFGFLELRKWILVRKTLKTRFLDLMSLPSATSTKTWFLSFFGDFSIFYTFLFRLSEKLENLRTLVFG